jgi:polyisoprenoid-binding protein YceI
VRRAFKFLFGALVIVVVIAIGFTAWFVFGDRAPSKPKLSACGQSTSGGPTTPDGRWHLAADPHAYVGYRIKELFGDAVLKHEVVGRTPAVTGGLTVVGGRVTSAVVTADVTKLASDRAARDTYILDNGLQSSKFPTARFTLVKPIAPGAPVTKGAAIHSQASGTLLLHGVTRPMTVAVTACWNGPTINVVGTAPIVLRDYGITPPHTVIADVDSHGSIELDLEFAPGAP